MSQVGYRRKRMDNPFCRAGYTGVPWKAGPYLQEKPLKSQESEKPFAEKGHKKTKRNNPIGSFPGFLFHPAKIFFASGD